MAPVRMNELDRGSKVKGQQRCSETVRRNNVLLIQPFLIRPLLLVLKAKEATE